MRSALRAFPLSSLPFFSFSPPPFHVFCMEGTSLGDPTRTVAFISSGVMKKMHLSQVTSGARTTLQPPLSTSFWAVLSSPASVLQKGGYEQQAATTSAE